MLVNDDELNPILVKIWLGCYIKSIINDMNKNEIIKKYARENEEKLFLGEAMKARCAPY